MRPVTETMSRLKGLGRSMGATISFGGSRAVLLRLEALGFTRNIGSS